MRYLPRVGTFLTELLYSLCFYSSSTIQLPQKDTHASLYPNFYPSLNLGMLILHPTPAVLTCACTVGTVYRFLPTAYLGTYYANRSSIYLKMACIFLNQVLHFF